MYLAFLGPTCATNRCVAAVKTGVYAQFNVNAPGGYVSDRDAQPNPDAIKYLDDVLDSVVWAPDPGNEAAWPAITDWVK